MMNKKRFIFHNPHVEIWYKTPLFHFLTKQVSVQKYTHLLDFFTERDKKITVLIDGSSSSIPNKKLQLLVPTIIEFYLWIIINGLNPFKFKVIRNVSKLTSNDVLFTFIYGNFTSQNGIFGISRENIIRNFAETKAYKVVHATHYMYHAKIGSLNCKDAKIDLFVAENNLVKNSAFFKHYFSWYTKKMYTLPFAPKARYKRFIPFAKRINKAIATGTITYPMNEPDFTSFFKHSMVHPMRVAIFENKEKLNPYLDSFISKITDGKKLVDNSSDKKLAKLFTTISNVFSKSQKKYFSMDIVQKYNEYKMFIVPEEINDLPGIGFAEGMACGSVFIGLDDPMYTDLGMQNKIHFISYNGTIDDLKSKIEYYQNNQAELEQIANNGYNFVLQNFDKDKICQDFFNYLNIE